MSHDVSRSIVLYEISYCNQHIILMSLGILEFTVCMSMFSCIETYLLLGIPTTITIFGATQKICLEVVLLFCVIYELYYYKRRVILLTLACWQKLCIWQGFLALRIVFN